MKEWFTHAEIRAVAPELFDAAGAPIGVLGARLDKNTQLMQPDWSRWEPPKNEISASWAAWNFHHSALPKNVVKKLTVAPAAAPLPDAG